MTKIEPNAKLLDGVERIKTLAMANAIAWSARGLSRTERLAHKAKSEAYDEALAALTDALLGAER